ncbi:MAG: c-di-AMP phosphodiesterase-like protein [Marinobacter psychrophilus]|jgi:c-di-AMP phosphodiesterase-like protein
MGFKDLVATFDDALRRHDKGNSLKRKELRHLEQALKKKRAKYRDRFYSGSSEETSAQTEVRLRVVEAQLAKLRELMEEASL